MCQPGSNPHLDSFPRIFGTQHGGDPKGALGSWAVRAMREKDIAFVGFGGWGAPDGGGSISLRSDSNWIPIGSFGPGGKTWEHMCKIGHLTQDMYQTDQMYQRSRSFGLNGSEAMLVARNDTGTLGAYHHKTTVTVHRARLSS